MFHRTLRFFLKKLSISAALLTSRGGLLMLAKFYIIFFVVHRFFLFNQQQFSGSGLLGLFSRCWFLLVAFWTGWALVLGVRNVFFPGSSARPSGIKFVHVLLVLVDADRLFSHHLAAVDAVIDWRSIHWPAFIWPRFRVCW